MLTFLPTVNVSSRWGGVRVVFGVFALANSYRPCLRSFLAFPVEDGDEWHEGFTAPVRRVVQRPQSHLWFILERREAGSVQMEGDAWQPIAGGFPFESQALQALEALAEGGAGWTYFTRELLTSPFSAPIAARPTSTQRAQRPASLPALSRRFGGCQRPSLVQQATRVREAALRAITARVRGLQGAARVRLLNALPEGQREQVTATLNAGIPMPRYEDSTARAKAVTL